MERERVLSIRDLRISFDTAHGRATAIRGMRMDLYRGETVAVVGESGSGKSVTAKAVMGIMSSNQHIEGGTIHYTYRDEHDAANTVDIAAMPESEVRAKICGKHIAMVFQDAMTSLNPTVTVGKQIIEGMREHYKLTFGRPGSALSSCSPRSVSQTPKSASHNIRISFPAACASAWASPSHWRATRIS